MLYNFPKEQFDDFKKFITEGSEVDIDVLLEQLSSELLWKKLLRKKFSSKIVISTKEIEKIITDEKKKLVNMNMILQKFFLKTKIIKILQILKKN